jgi:hypothetical protein
MKQTQSQFNKTKWYVIPVNDPFAFEYDSKTEALSGMTEKSHRAGYHCYEVGNVYVIKGDAVEKHGFTSRHVVSSHVEGRELEKLYEQFAQKEIEA